MNIKLLLTLFVAPVILISCSKIPYNTVVIPKFKKRNPGAVISQIYPAPNYGLDSYIGKKTDVVILFHEKGHSRMEKAQVEIWTVTHNDGWQVTFKCRANENEVCLDSTDSQK